MKPKETSLNTRPNADDKITDELIEMAVEELGENHLATNYDTPLRKDAFDLSNEQKIQQIQGHFEKIMTTLGLDLADESLAGTPRRVAKMFVNEIFAGLNPENKPKVTKFENIYRYNQMLVERNIKVHSFCEHHFLPIIGKAHVAYIPNGKVAGLSKLNRIVDYYARRPQVQERLTRQILKGLQEELGTEHVAIIIDAEHHCVKLRGVKDNDSTTVTTQYAGLFSTDKVKTEFLKLATGK